MKKKILDVKLSTSLVTPELATVTADITAKIQVNPVYNDRYALNYRLWRTNGRWQIYKIELAKIEHPIILPGQLPNSAKKILEEYFAMPYELKKFNECEYLAGRALPSLPTSKVGIYRKEPPTKTSKGFEVLNVNCIGVAERYCVAKVTYRGGNNDIISTAIVDMVEVAGQWKIAKIDIAVQKGG